MTGSNSTRIYLAVPFDENDQVRLHGARFDWERRQWWIDGRKIVANPGIARWLVDRPRSIAQLRKAADFLEGERQQARTDSGARIRLCKAGKPPRTATSDKPAKVTPATSFLLPCCACSSPPWDHCEHTAPLQSSVGLEA